MIHHLRYYWRKWRGRCQDCGRRRDRPHPAVLCSACFNAIVERSRFLSGQKTSF